MSAFLDETGTLVTVSSSNPLPVGGNIFNEGREVSSSNPLPVAQPDGLAVSGTVTGVLANQATSGIPTVLFTTSMLNYESITVQVTSAGSSCTVTYEASEDGVNWQTTSGLTTSNVGVSANATTSSTTLILQFPRKSSNFRARVSTYGLAGSIVSVVGTLSKVPVAQIGFVHIGGGISPEGGGANTSPLAIGLEGRTSSKTSVTNATLVRPISTVDGRQITRLNSIPENEWQYAAASGGITNTSDVVLQAAAGAGIKNYLTGLSVANASATATEVVVKDGSTVIWRGYLAANLQLKDIPFPTPLQSTANTALNVACITTGTQTYINAQGYKAP